MLYNDFKIKWIELLYLQALDIWMGACTAFVFSALIEFTIVNYIWRKDLKARGGGSGKWWVINHSVFNKGQLLKGKLPQRSICFNFKRK